MDIRKATGNFRQEYVTHGRTFKPWPDAFTPSRKHFFTDLMTIQAAEALSGGCAPASLALFLGHHNNKASPPEDP
ncbi:hypothetical protein [Pseudomonas sp. 30_B]|uniref:hypothetical protein n=1 Tax=Pseudomonas sp. 30_B TaxID=2813575 RepID=UPI001A9EED01|nr:hypothetical protein [Pseudomonas sp. 30_B]